ncbi:hypothetical protein BDQ17DRAFT_1369400, partial [Cyathus striatus]
MQRCHYLNTNSKSQSKDTSQHSPIMSETKPESRHEVERRNVVQNTTLRITESPLSTPNKKPEQCPALLNS